MRTFAHFIHDVYGDAQRRMNDSIRASQWFRAAPKAAQEGAEVTFIGVERRTTNSLMGTRDAYDALVAECKCGGEVKRFAMRLIFTGGDVESIDH